MNPKTRLLLIVILVVVLLGGGITVFIFLSQRGAAPTLTGIQGIPTVIEPTPTEPTREPTTGVPTPTTPTQQFGAPLPTTDTVARCTGGDPISLTINCNKVAFPQTGSAQKAYLYRSDNTVDAFAATPLIGIDQATSLAVDTNNISQATLDELTRVLQSKTSPIVILGGTAAVSQNVENQLQAAGFTNRTRIFGANRYETATAIADKIIAGNSNIQSAFLTEGSLLVDAYGVGPVAAGTHPNTGESFILLTTRGGSSLHPSTRDYLQSHPNIKIVAIVGGEAAVPDSIEQELKDLGIILVQRIADIDRVWTNYRIIQQYFLTPTRAFVANAYPDKGANALYSAQAAATLAALYGEPLLMIDPAFVPEGQQIFLCAFADDITLAEIAGNGVDVSSAAEAELLQLIKKTHPFCSR